jgi:hypothetical protein
MAYCYGVQEQKAYTKYFSKHDYCGQSSSSCVFSVFRKVNLIPVINCKGREFRTQLCHPTLSHEDQNK